MEQRLQEALQRMEAGMRDMDERYQAAIGRNDQLVNANEILRAANLQDTGNRREQQGRIDGLEAALRDMGLQANGAGGFNVRGGRGGRGGGRGGGQGGGHGGGNAMEEDWDQDRPVPPPAGGAPRNPRMPNLSFEGKDVDDWMSFRAAFINTCNFNQYSDQQAKYALLGCMRGSAFLTVANVNHEDVNFNIVDVLDDYEARFLPPAASDMARTRYETATQGVKESVLEWHGRLRMLHTRAYGNEGNENQLIRAFSHGLRSRKVKENLLRAQAQTYDHALNVAQTEQAVQDSMNYIPGSVPNFATTIAGQKPRRKDGSEPMEIGAIGDGRKQCHICHQFGHIAKDCTLMKKPKVVDANGKVNLGNRTPNPAKKGSGFKNAGGKTFDKKPRFGRHVNAVGDVVKEDEEGDDPEEETAEDEESPDKPDPEDSEDESQDFYGSAS
jgi:hypothetical protein